MIIAIKQLPALLSAANFLQRNRVTDELFDRYVYAVTKDAVKQHYFKSGDKLEATVYSEIKPIVLLFSAGKIDEDALDKILQYWFNACIAAYWDAMEISED